MRLLLLAYIISLCGGIYTGLVEFNGISFVLFVIAFALAVRALNRSAPRQDSRTRNQAHPWRRL